MIQVSDRDLIDQICNTREEEICGMFGVWVKLIKLNNNYYLYTHYSLDNQSVKKEFFEINENELKIEGFKKIAKEILSEISRS